MEIQHQHLLTLSVILLFIAYMVSAHIWHIRAKGYDLYFQKEYKPMYPESSRGDFTLYIYSSFCIAAMLYGASLGTGIYAIKKLIEL
jgi:hypothetical protein